MYVDFYQEVHVVAPFCSYVFGLFVKPFKIGNSLIFGTMLSLSIFQFIHLYKVYFLKLASNKIQPY